MQKYKIILISLLVTLFTTSSHAQDLGALVVGGTPTPSASPVSKAMMLLRINGATCSGVAISKQHILTAGHCVDKKPTPSSILVYQGTNKVSQAKVQSYVRHSRYGWERNRLRGDLTILKMSAPFDSGVTPAPLFNSSLPSGAQVLAAGFGWSNPNKTRIRKLYQTVYIWNQNASLDSERFSDGTRLIEFRSPKALCGGDSGGATFVNTSSGLRTIGIHSMADCMSTGFDVYTLDHRSWVNDNTSN